MKAGLVNFDSKFMRLQKYFFYAAVFNLALGAIAGWSGDAQLAEAVCCISLILIASQIPYLLVIIYLFYWLWRNK